MKKWIFVLVAMLLVGGVGSAVSTVYTTNKVNVYLEQKRSQLNVDESLLNTDSKVNTVRIDNLAPNTVIKVRKSNDNKAYVKVKSVVGEKKFNARIENNNLIVSADDIVKEYNDKILGNGVATNSDSFMNTLEIYKSLINTENVRDFLDLAAMSGVTLRNRDILSVETTTTNNLNELEINIPESANFELNHPMFFSEINGYDIENGLVKDYIKIKEDSYIISSVKYNSKVNNVIVDSVSGFFELGQGDIDRIRANGMSISKLIINTGRNASIETDDLRGKIADEIVVNISDQKMTYRDNANRNLDIDSDVYPSSRTYEDRVYERVKDEINDNDGYDDIYEIDDEFISAKNYEEYLRGIGAKIRIKDDIELFKDEIKNNIFGSSEKDIRHFDSFVNVGSGIADKFTINAPKNKVRVMLSDLNMNLDLAADKIDMKYLLFGKAPSANILKLASQKIVNTSFVQYLNGVKNGSAISVGNLNKDIPSLVVRAKEVRLIEDDDDDDFDDRYDHDDKYDRDDRHDD